MKKYKNETKNLIITGTMRHLYVHFYWGKKGEGLFTYLPLALLLFRVSEEGQKKIARWSSVGV